MTTYQESYQRWLRSDKLTAAEREELQGITDEEEIRSRFSCYLSFGTAGLRGRMKTGANAMNTHTVAYATQGLAALILKEGRAASGVAIAYDCRNNSRLFAQTAASVLAGNGIKVYLFDDLRPTPELSFAVRALHCVAGINITASHNPREYNGYKAYWEDGAQLSPEQADVVSSSMASLDIFDDVKTTDFEQAVKEGKIEILDAQTDEKYLAAVEAQVVYPGAVEKVAQDLKIVYSPLHGAGHRLVPEIMRRIGLKHLYTVPAQMEIDGDFPTVKKPNPEYPEVFEQGIEIANRVGSDLIIATDPDADRVGVMSRTKDGSFTTITGNQMGSLLLDYIITAHEERGDMPQNPYAVKSIVSTELFSAICAQHGVKMFNVLTGFKFIGGVIEEHERNHSGSFLLGFEESYGYLTGTYARDKDAVVASMLICEMTAYYKAKGMTLSDALENLFERYGYFFETNDEIYMEGIDGAARMAALMNRLRENPPREFGGNPVLLVADYLKMTITSGDGVISTGMPKSDVLKYQVGKDTVVIRPSGTEPKIKFYYLLSGENQEQVLRRLDGYKKTVAQLVK